MQGISIEFFGIKSVIIYELHNYLLLQTQSTFRSKTSGLLVF